MSIDIQKRKSDVFNIHVNTTNNYVVSSLEILVHNSCKKDRRKKKGKPKKYEKNRSDQASEIMNAQDKLRSKGRVNDIFSTKRAEQEERAVWRRGIFDDED